jgi:hypothetical protein
LALALVVTVALFAAAEAEGDPAFAVDDTEPSAALAVPTPSFGVADTVAAALSATAVALDD